jgi:hypothetical protein
MVTSLPLLVSGDRTAVGVGAREIKGSVVAVGCIWLWAVAVARRGGVKMLA